jgi:diguanylate cyclase (GGDEF)-like protein
MFPISNGIGAHTVGEIMESANANSLTNRVTQLRKNLASIFSFNKAYDEQLTSVVANQRKSLIASLLVVTIVVTAFRDSPLFNIALPWGILALVLTISSILHARLKKYSDVNNFVRENAARYSTYFAGLRGLHWAAGLAVLMPTADTVLQFMLGWVIIGMASGGAFAYWSLPSAAIAYVAIIGLGGMIGLVLTGKAACILMAVALFLYCAFVLRHALSSAALLRAHVETKHTLEESRSDVVILLSHFEEDSSDWIWQMGADLRHKRNLDRFAKALECSASSIANTNWSDMIRPLLKDERQSLFYTKFEALLSQENDVRDAILYFGKPDDERVWKVSAHAKRTANGAFAGWDGVVSDITEQRRSEAKVLHLAHHDVLTGLPNRARFEQVYTETTAIYDSTETGAYLLYIDLDGFKGVNDTLGHVTGDQLLKQVCDRLKEVTRRSDVLARYGGDEFLLLSLVPEGKSQVERLAQRICSVMAEPFKILDQQVLIGASIGVAAVGKDGVALNVVLRHADLALYRAKEEGRNQVKFFEPSMDEKERHRRDLKVDMRTALVQNQFRLHYQPIVGTEDGKVAAYEALLRWQHPERGNIPPLDFIPLAEENGFIVELGAWILNEACRQASSWNNDVRVSVNLSAVQIRSPLLLPTVVNALADSGLLPHRLELEVTETSLVEDKDAAFATLRALKALGVSIALDDFGTGYSSLAYIHEFPFDKIKIDRSFVQSCETRKQSAAVVHAVLGLASELGMSTVAEGVETAEQLALLTEKGCNEAQGYYLGKPKSAKELFSNDGQKLESVA